MTNDPQNLFEDIVFGGLAFLAGCFLIVLIILILPITFTMDIFKKLFK